MTQLTCSVFKRFPHVALLWLASLQKVIAPLLTPGLLMVPNPESANTGYGLQFRLPKHRLPFWGLFMGLWVSIRLQVV